jgi:hypothetical protein
MLVEHFDVKKVAGKIGGGVAGAGKTAGGGIVDAGKTAGGGVVDAGKKIKDTAVGGIWGWFTKAWAWLKFVISALCCCCVLSLATALGVPQMIMGA